jgi:hypothetical protein
MKQKKLQDKSKYASYDINQDGVVSDEEFERMATASLVAMATFTAAMFFVDLDRVKALADISNLFYITGGGIVAAYMGASAIMNRNGK